MTDTPLVERLRGHADRQIDDNLRYIQTADELMREAASEIERLSKTRNEVIEECAVWIAEHGPALSTLAAAELLRILSQEQSK